MKPPFDAYQGEGAFVFVCYSHDDKARVYPELEWLRDQGVNIWYDEGIATGAEWPDRIAQAVEDAEKFLFYLSPDSASSRVCRDEVRLARMADKPIVTVQLEPTELDGGLDLTLGSSQALIKDAYQTSGDYRDQLLSVILDTGTIGLSRNKSRRGRSSSLMVLAVLLAVVAAPWVYRYVSGDPNGTSRDPAVNEILPSSIAVLPFVDMSPGRDLEYLGDGMAEELIHGLTQVAGMNVIARTSSFSFKNQNLNVQLIGRQLAVDTVLEGSIRREADTLRVNLQLINVVNGFHIWSKQFEGSVNKIFQLQDEIAHDVVEAVIPTAVQDAGRSLTDAGTTDANAWEAYLLGRYERTRQTRDSIDRAIEYFQRAIRLDSGFLRAYEALIDAYIFKGSYYGHRDDMMARAEAALEQALQADPEKQDPAWFWMELSIRYGENIASHFRDAEELYSVMIVDRSHIANRGQRVMGYYQYALLLARSGFFDAALELMIPLEAIDPMDVSIKLRLAELYAAVGDYERSLQKYDDLLALSPRYVQAKLDLFLLNGKLGRVDEAQAIRQELAVAFSDDLTALLDALLVFWRGDRAAALDRLVAVAGSPEIPPNYLGVAFLALGDWERAFFHLHLAADQGDPYVSELMLTQTRLIPVNAWPPIQESDEFLSLMSRFDYDEAWPSELAQRANAISGYTDVIVRVE